MDDKSLLTVNVVTPDGVVYDNTTDLAVCKTTLGEVGIMPNRVPLLASLAIDEVRVKTGEDGFIEFSNNVLSVVASAAERKENIDASRAERARARAEKRIATAKETHNVDDLRRAEVSLRRAMNRLNVSKH